jgi:hypothetical protein
MNRFAFTQLALVGLLALSMTACPANTKNTPEKASDKPDKKGSNGKKEPQKAPTPKVKVKAMKQSEMTSPWRHARIGDTAEFSPHFVGTTTFRYEVTKIGNGSLTFTVGPKGKQARAVTLTLEQLEKDYHPPETLQPPPKVENKELKTASGTLKCVVYTRKGLGTTTETWLCKDFPINGGIVRSKKNGALNLDIKSWKRAK